MLNQLLNHFIKVFRVRPIGKPRKDSGSNVVNLFCRTGAIRTLTNAQVESFISSLPSDKVTVEDFDFSISQLKLALRAKGSYLSVFVALNVGDSVQSFLMSYSTESGLLQISPLQ